MRFRHVSASHLATIVACVHFQRDPRDLSSSDKSFWIQSLIDKRNVSSAILFARVYTFIMSCEGILRTFSDLSREIRELVFAVACQLFHSVSDDYCDTSIRASSREGGYLYFASQAWYQSRG